MEKPINPEIAAKLQELESARKFCAAEEAAFMQELAELQKWADERNIHIVYTQTGNRHFTIAVFPPAPNDTLVKFALAVGNPNEQPHKAQGRSVALRRAQCGHVQYAPLKGYTSKIAAKNAVLRVWAM